MPRPAPGKVDLRTARNVTAPRPLSALVLLAALAAAAPPAPAAPQSPSAIPYYPELLEKLKSPSSISRRQAALDLAKMGADARAAVPDLQKALLDTEPPVRSAAAFALGEIGTAAEPASTTLLRSVTSDKDANVRKDCAAAIAKIGPKALKTIPGLISLLRQESDAEVREAIASAIVRVGPNARETITGLVEKTADPSPVVREIALRALGRIGPAARAALPAVEKAAADSDAKHPTRPRPRSSGSTARSRDPVEEDRNPTKTRAAPEWKGFTIADLLTLLKSPTPSTRLKAIRAVDARRAQLGADAKGATAAITAILKDDPETAVRASAATTLGSLGMESPELTSRPHRSRSPGARAAAARVAIGSLGAKGRGSARALTLARVRDVASPVRRLGGGGAPHDRARPRRGFERAPPIPN